MVDRGLTHDEASHLLRLVEGTRTDIAESVRKFTEAASRLGNVRDRLRVVLRQAEKTLESDCGRSIVDLSRRAPQNRRGYQDERKYGPAQASEDLADPLACAMCKSKRPTSIKQAASGLGPRASNQRRGCHPGRRRADRGPKLIAALLLRNLRPTSSRASIFWHTKILA